MKLVCGLLTCLALGLAVLVSQGQPAQPIKVTWSGNLATIEWTEPLADARAGKRTNGFFDLEWTVDRLALSHGGCHWLGSHCREEAHAEPYATLPVSYPAEKMQFRSVTLKDLKPDTEYRYQLQSGTYKSQVLPFRTLPGKDATSFKFAMIGDTQRGEVPASAEIERKLFALY